MTMMFVVLTLNNGWKKNNLNQKKSATFWLTTLPPKNERYVLTKQLCWNLVNEKEKK